MADLRELFATSPAIAMMVAGALVGLAFGALARSTNFCTMGAIADWRLYGDKGRLGAAALAAAVAIVGANALSAAGVTDLSQSIYLTPRVNWLGASLGGLLFGFGMVYAGGCPSRALIRAGGGDLRAGLVLMVMSIAALAALSGVMAQARAGLDRMTALDVAKAGMASQGLHDALAWFGLAPNLARPLAAAAIAAPLTFFAFHSGKVWSKPRNLIAGIGVGGLVVLAWALTGLAYDEMSAAPMQPTALSFVKPVADAIDWLERSTALGLPGFAAASVFGVLAGSMLTARAGRALALTGFADRADLTRHVLGGAAMGVGGIAAMGCTIGQGVSGLSTLSLQSVIACPAIVAGAVLALRRLERSE